MKMTTKTKTKTKPPRMTQDDVQTLAERIERLEVQVAALVKLMDPVARTERMLGVGE